MHGKIHLIQRTFNRRTHFYSFAMCIFWICHFYCKLLWKPFPFGHLYCANRMFSFKFDSIQMSSKHTNHSPTHTTEKYIFILGVFFLRLYFRECCVFFSSAKPNSSTLNFEMERNGPLPTQCCFTKLHLEFIGFCWLRRFMAIEIDIFTGDGSTLFG